MDNGGRKIFKMKKEVSELKKQIAAIIEDGRRENLQSELIVNEIFRKVIIDQDIVVEEGIKSARPILMEDILIITKKALEQAQFEGVFVLLPSGEKIKRRENI